MSTVNVTKSGPADLLDNFPGAGLQDYTDATREYKPANERPDWRVEVARGVLILGGVALLWLFWGLWKTAYCWGGANWQACERINVAEPVAVVLLFLSAGAASLSRSAVRTWAEWRMTTARAARIATTYNRWGDPQRVDVPLSLAEQMRRYDLATALKERTAPHEAWHSINTFSPSLQLPKGDAPALPPPAELAPLVPVSEWLSWVDGLPHVILAAETGAGKSTTAKAILAGRIAAGEHVFIIDPHSSDWFGLPSVGGGEDWPTVRMAMEAVVTEYRRRLETRDAYKRETGRELATDQFNRLTVLLDEANHARTALDRGRRGDVTPWQAFAQMLGSGARKVRISIVLLCQSANVQDLGLSSAMRENFTRIALDSAAARRLVEAEETNAERRRALYAALDGRDFPAVCEYRGRVHLLDRRGLDRVPAPADPQAALWPTWDYSAPVPTPAPAPSNGLPVGLRERAATFIGLAGGDREKAARVLLKRPGTRVRGRYEYTVEEVARATQLRTARAVELAHEVGRS